MREGKNLRIALILAMHRSGSSLLTSIVHDLGFETGSNLLASDQYNSEGYWEFKPLVNLHERMLSEFGNTWFAPAHHMPVNVLIRRYRNEAELLIQEMDDTGMDWCWKDPRLLLFLDFWKEILSDREVFWVIAHRAPGAVARSLEARDGFELSHALRLWEHYLLEANRRASLLKRWHIVQYEALLADPIAQILDLSHFLQPDWNDETNVLKSEKASQRIKKEGIHVRNYADINYSDSQSKLEQALGSGMLIPIEDISGLEQMTRHRFFRQVLRETEGVTPKTALYYETLLSEERQKVKQLHHAIDSLKESMTYETGTVHEQYEKLLREEREKVHYLNQVIRNISAQLEQHLYSKKNKIKYQLFALVKLFNRAVKYLIKCFRKRD